jgi:hypothetical protein
MIQFDGVLESVNCGVHLNVNTTSVQLQAYYTKAMNYTLMVTLLAFLQARRTPDARAMPMRTRLRAANLTLGWGAALRRWCCW